MELHPLRLLRNLGRSREIATVLLNHGFGDLVERLHLSRPLHWGRRLFSRKPEEPHVRLTVAQRIRLALESLGPTFIKFGQVVSTRSDLVPAEIIKELSQLQENVPVFPSDTAIEIVETELGQSVDELFKSFDRIPLAAGSLAQVHSARGFDGRRLAVKIRRPDVVRNVERDLSLMAELAALIDRHIPEAHAFDPVGLVNHFTRTIRREMSFNREARTLDEFGRLFRNDASLVLPSVDWQRTTDAVLTMDLIDGVHVDDTAQLMNYGIRPEDVARNGARIFLKMAFELGVFHSDPHPGNLRIMRDGAIALLDFGMIGRLDEEKREQLVDLLLAVSKKDVRSAVEIVLQLGQPSGEVDRLLLHADIQDFIESYYDVELKRLKVGQMLTDFMRVLKNHTIHCPPDFMLLVRALVTLEGVGRDISPSFKLASELAPIVKRAVRERFNPRRFGPRLEREVRTFAKLAHDLPLHVGRTLEKLSKDDLRIQLEHRSIDHLITELDRSSNRIVIGVVMSALILASALVLRSGGESNWLSVAVFTLSSLLGVWLIYGVFRSGRL